MQQVNEVIENEQKLDLSHLSLWHACSYRLNYSSIYRLAIQVLKTRSSNGYEICQISILFSGYFGG